MNKTLENTIDALVGASADTIEKDVLYWLIGEDVDTLDEATNLLENVSCEQTAWDLAEELEKLKKVS